MSTKLKIVVSLPGAFAATDFSEHKEEIEKAQEEGHTPCTIEYLHGKVQQEMGYDIGLCLNAEECIDFENEEKYKEGEYEVEVIGYDNPCKAFLWNSNLRPRGLIVDITKPEDLQYAEIRYKEKRYWL